MAVTEGRTKTVAPMSIVNSADRLGPGKPPAVILARCTIGEDNRIFGTGYVGGLDAVPKTVSIAGKVETIDTIAKDYLWIPLNSLL